LQNDRAEMRQYVGKRLLLLGLCLGVAAVAGCGGPGQPHPDPGTLTISFQPQPASVAGLSLATATLQLDRIQVIGNRPPPDPPPPMPLTVDALATSATSTAAMHPPPGVYSRVQLSVEQLTVTGTWRGTPLEVHLGMFGGNQVDVRSASGTGIDLEPGDDVTLPVQINVGSWFADNVLDGAMVVNGRILCDPQHNGPTSMQLSMRVNLSFSLP
jgi:hypothetical protein